jgi:hypothetical protein
MHQITRGIRCHRASLAALEDGSLELIEQAYLAVSTGAPAKNVSAGMSTGAQLTGSWRSKSCAPTSSLYGAALCCIRRMPANPLLYNGSDYQYDTRTIQR